MRPHLPLAGPLADENIATAGHSEVPEEGLEPPTRGL